MGSAEGEVEETFEAMLEEALDELAKTERELAAVDEDTALHGHRSVCVSVCPRATSRLRAYTHAHVRLYFC